MRVVLWLALFLTAWGASAVWFIRKSRHSMPNVPPRTRRALLIRRSVVAGRGPDEPKPGNVPLRVTLPDAPASAGFQRALARRSAPRPQASPWRRP
jgi:hypothetical protein